MKKRALQRLLVLGLCGFHAAGCDTLESDQQEVGLPNRNIVTGTVLVAGCTPPASTIVVTAAEVRLEQSQDYQQVDPPVKRAVVVPTNDPHMFALRFIGLDARTAYRLSAELSQDAPCPKTVWRGPDGGWFAGGTRQPIRIEGAALRTQTEILGVRDANPSNGAQWGAAEPVDFTDPQGAVRTVRWQTDVPGAVYGLVQVSAAPFSGRIGQQSPAPQIVASWYVPRGQQGWSELPALDFGQLVRSSCDPQQYPNGCPVCDPQSPDGCAQFQTVRGALQKELLHGAPLYVRVVPVDQFGNLLDELKANGLPSDAKLVSIPHRLPVDMPPADVAPLQMHIAYQPATNQYALGHNGGCYRITEAHATSVNACNPWSPDVDVFACLLRDRYPLGSAIPAGATFCLDYHSGGFLSDAWDAATGFFDALGSLCNDISKLYTKIKQDVVNAVASVVDDLGVIHCGDECKAALMAALDTGLAAMGLPPSLPNWDELKAEGIDYLEDLAAEESGIDKMYIEQMRAIAARAINNMTPDHGGLPSWMVSDDGFRPPLVTFTISKNPAFVGPTLPNTLTFDAYDAYYAPELSLPGSALAEGRTYHIPMNLVPEMTGLTRFCVSGLTGDCRDFQPLTQEHLEDDWYNTKYSPMPCLRFGAKGNAYGYVDGGSRWLFGTFFDQLRWTVPTLTNTESDSPFLMTCSG